MKEREAKVIKKGGVQGRESGAVQFHAECNQCWPLVKHWPRGRRKIALSLFFCFIARSLECVTNNKPKQLKKKFRKGGKKGYGPQNNSMNGERERERESVKKPSSKPSGQEVKQGTKAKEGGGKEKSKIRSSDRLKDETWINYLYREREKKTRKVRLEKVGKQDCCEI